MLARAVLTEAKDRDGPLSIEEKLEAFNRCYAIALDKGVLCPGQTKDEYKNEFMHACKTAKIPLNTTIIQMALAAVATEPPPPEADRYESPEGKRLVGLCYQLAKISEGEFFLSCRDAGKAIGKSHTVGAQWLSGMVEMNILKIVKKHTPEDATHYTYCSSEPKPINQQNKTL